jgi:proteic killer suppression protein
MIERFRHKGLRQLFEDDNPKGLNPQHVRKITQILGLLNAAQKILILITQPSGFIR